MDDELPELTEEERKNDYTVLFHDTEWLVRLAAKAPAVIVAFNHVAGARARIDEFESLDAWNALVAEAYNELRDVIRRNSNDISDEQIDSLLYVPAGHERMGGGFDLGSAAAVRHEARRRSGEPVMTPQTILVTRLMNSDSNLFVSIDRFATALEKRRMEYLTPEGMKPLMDDELFGIYELTLLHDLQRAAGKNPDIQPEQVIAAIRQLSDRDQAACLGRQAYALRLEAQAAR